MTEAWNLVCGLGAGFGAGLGAGLIFFGGLWLTVKALLGRFSRSHEPGETVAKGFRPQADPQRPHLSGFLVASFGARLALSMALLGAVCTSHASAWVAAMAGLLAGKAILLAGPLSRAPWPAPDLDSERRPFDGTHP